MKKLAILIPTIEGREEKLDRLLQQLYKQINQCLAKDVIIMTNNNKEKSTGAKRNQLIQWALTAGADYVSQFDDDDLPGPTYIQRQLEVVASGKDCGSLWGNIYFGGKKGKPFHHSIKYDHWWEDRKKYARCTNHLNCIRLSIVKDFPFPDQSFGEDGKQSMAMAEAKVLKTEHVIDDVIYHYFTGNKDTELEKQVIKELIG